MRVVGVDVGTHQIKVVEVAAGNRGFQIAAYHTLQLKPNPTQDVDLEVIEFLRNLVSKMDLGNTRFVMGVRQDKVAVRHRTFPFTEKNKISKALPLELEDELPFAVENAVIDFKMINTRGNQAEILACATPRANIERLISFFKDVGAQLDIISPEGIAFANLFEKFDQPVPQEIPVASPTDVAEGAAMAARTVDVILHIGHTRTLICAIDKNRLVAVRSLLWGGKNIIDGLSIKYQLPASEALKEMELKGFILNSKQTASFEAKVFSDTISQAVREMVRDLQLSLLEIKTELQCDIKGLQLSGPVAQIQGLGAFLTQMLELPVNKVRLWDRFNQVLFERSELLESKLAIALGLALEGLKKPRNPALNFLKGDFSNRPSGFSTLWATWGLSVKWGSALVVALITWGILRADFASQLSTASLEALKTQAKNVARLNNRNANEKGVKKYISEKRKVAQEMKSVAQMMKVTTAFDVLKRVSEMAPPANQIKLDVRRFYIQDQRVWIEGFVRTPAEVSLLQQSLKGLALDGKLNTQRPTIQVPRGSTVFAFSFNVDRGLSRE